MSPEEEAAQQAAEQQQMHEAEALVVDAKFRAIAEEHSSLVVACSALGVAGGLFSALIEGRYVSAPKIGNLYGQSLYIALRPLEGVIALAKPDSFHVGQQSDLFQ